MSKQKPGSRSWHFFFHYSHIQLIMKIFLNDFRFPASSWTAFPFKPSKSLLPFSFDSFYSSQSDFLYNINEIISLWFVFHCILYKSKLFTCHVPFCHHSPFFTPLSPWPSFCLFKDPFSHPILQKVPCRSVCFAWKSLSHIPWFVSSVFLCLALVLVFQKNLSRPF